MGVVAAALIGLAGVVFTIFALVRLRAALRSGAPRELVLGWLALMLVGAASTFLLLRV